MRDTVCEMSDPPIKDFITAYYIPWFSDVDNSTEWGTYADGLSGLTLPIICRIDPADPDNYLDRSTGVQDPNDFYDRLRNGVDTGGDIDGVPGVDLGDVVVSMQIFSSLNDDTVNLEGDVNNDNKIGMEDFLFMLRELAGINP